MLVGTGLALGLALLEGGGGGFFLDLRMEESGGHADALRIEGGDAGFPVQFTDVLLVSHGQSCLTSGTRNPTKSTVHRSFVVLDVLPEQKV